MEAIIGLSIIGLFIVGVIVVVIHGNKREKALRQLADSMGFSFDGTFTDEDGGFLKSLNHLALFRMNDQGVWNVMYGKVNGVAVAIFDHRFGSGSGDSRKVSEQTVIVFQSDQLSLPYFTMRLEGLGHKLSSSILGYKDINFDMYPEFSKKYHLHGSDEEAIRKIFRNRVISVFEQHGKWSVDGSGDTLMVSRFRKTVAVKDIRDFIEQGFEVFGLFKEASA